MVWRTLMKFPVGRFEQDGLGSCPLILSVFRTADEPRPNTEATPAASVHQNGVKSSSVRSVFVEGGELLTLCGPAGVTRRGGLLPSPHRATSFVIVVGVRSG